MDKYKQAIKLFKNMIDDYIVNGKEMKAYECAIEGMQNDQRRLELIGNYKNTWFSKADLFAHSQKYDFKLKLEALEECEVDE